MDNQDYDDDYEDETDETSEDYQPPKIKMPSVPQDKRQWKEGEKQKVKSKEYRKVIKSNLKYENKELIDKTDDLAEQLLTEQGKNKHRDNFFPLMIEKMGLKIGAEIGVDKAGFSNHILSKTKIETYYCIDTWQDDFGSDCKPEYFDKDGNKRFNEALNALNALKSYGSRVVMMRMTGMEASTKIPNESLDFIYIDGDHSLEGIYTDIKAWLPKLKIGGLIGGHDYKDGPKSGINDNFGRQLDYKVKTVVDYYCQRYGHKLNIVGGRILSWWFIKNNPTQDQVMSYLMGK